MGDKGKSDVKHRKKRGFASRTSPKWTDKRPPSTRLGFNFHKVLKHNDLPLIEAIMRPY
jgi:hypothetical protein